MWFKIWTIFLLLFYKILISYSLFEEEYPGTNICQSDNFAKSSLDNIAMKLELLDAISKKNCTHIQGSLYIRGLRNIGSKKVLNFDTIKEIDGHLVIETNDFERISLKNLRIIRGLTRREKNLFGTDTKFFSLDVSGNKFLKELDLRSLRSINEYNVIFDDNPLLEFLPLMINWNELFTNNIIQKLVIPENQAHSSRNKCSSKCRIWAGANQTYCWGSTDDLCQQKTLCGSKYSTSCDSNCYYMEGQEVGCCSEQCLGGCTKMGPTGCIACKGMLNENKCTESCPGPYTGGIGGTVRNKEFKYHTGSFCSKSCPILMLPEVATCVHKCSDGYFKNSSNHCIPCKENYCKDYLPCDMTKLANKTEDYLSKATLLKLTNCTKIRGYMVIDKNTFRSGVTIQMLYDNLKNVQDFEGGFNYYLDKTLKNLTFFQNLKTFRSANLHIGNSEMPPYNRFTVIETGLEFLGLKSLKNITGLFLFKDNPELCYMNFPRSVILDMKLYDYVATEICANKICHEECLNGCWGPGNQMCYECRHFNANGKCVSDCKLENGFYFPKNESTANKTCLACHKECQKSCTGPGSHECLNGCRNKIENGRCVSNCSKKYYLSPTDNKLCLPCHRNCEAKGKQICTGNSSKPGPGGCNKCSIILLDKSSQIVQCVSQCPERTFKLVKEDEYISKYYYGRYGHTCFPCHDLCSNCTGLSDKRIDCTTCNGFWYRDLCTKMCPKEDSYRFENNGSQKICSTCDPACNGCTGPQKTDCVRCKSRKIYLDGKKFYCNQTCPSHKEKEELEEFTGEKICLSLWESKSKLDDIKRTKITVAVVLTMLLLMIVVIVIIVVCLRRKANTERLESELKARYSNLTEPNSKDEDMLNKPPNMGRLVIVSKEDLTFEDESRPLGFGAFGYVYKGRWKIPKDEDTLLRKTSADFYLPVAIKVIKNMGDEEMESIMQEAKMMASVSHLNCLRFIGVCLSYDKPCLISAYVKEGSLDKYLIRNKNKITSFIMLNWAEQIADGMLYLTKRNIIHRDLAVRNVLVNRLECVQITDFGLAKMLESKKEKEIIIKTGKVPIRWLAIETLTEGKYSHETDVWAYGVTLWEIFTYGKVPYEDQATHDIFDFVLKGGRLSQPDICSLDVYILMINCWLESPNLRPDFQSLMKTFVDYCKNPGRYLSIQGDPYEIPTPNNIEMTNLDNPYYKDHFNFAPNTAETMLPLINSGDTLDSDVKDFSQEDERDNLMSSMSDKEPLPTRSINRAGNIFKRFQENRQPQTSTNTRSNNNNTPRLVSLASQEEPMFRSQPLISDDDPRYVADPTDKSIKMRPQPLKTNLLRETPRFHSNTSKENNSPFNHSSISQSPYNSSEVDGYLEPIRPNNDANIDTEGYLEPVKSPNKDSMFSTDEYMVPSQPNTPRESMMNNKPLRISNAFKQNKNYITMDDEKNHLSKTLPDNEYLEPEPSRRLINNSHK